MGIKENRIDISNFVQNYKYEGKRHPDCPLCKVEGNESIYKQAWDYLEMCLIKGLDVPKEVLYTLYELVKRNEGE